MDVIIVTGGTGYIGSHTVLHLLQTGKHVVIIDNCITSSELVIPKLHELSNGNQITAFHKIDLVDWDRLSTTMMKYKGRISCVIHFAGLKSVEESIHQPIEYYHNNVTGTVNLLRAMVQCNCKNIIFSSSATVYGNPQELPVTEKTSTFGINPYGRTKLMVENILEDVCNSDSSWKVILLRYFNPVGAHPSGIIGESIKGVPSNLLPYIAQVCSGKRPYLRVFGNDYDTKDGTGLRDYIHIEDVAIGHLCALDFMKNNLFSGCKTYNLGSGNGHTVLEVVQEMRKVSGKEIPIKIESRRHTDVASCWADASLAKQELGWEAKYDLSKMCEDLWRFQSQNPDGYL